MHIFFVTTVTMRSFIFLWQKQIYMKKGGDGLFGFGSVIWELESHFYYLPIDLHKDK